MSDARQPRFDPTEAILSLSVSVWIATGLDQVGPAFWTMVEQGVDAGIRWPGRFLLVAIALDLLGIWFSKRSLPPPSTGEDAAGRITESLAIVVMSGSRWLVTLMLLILGLLGLGIDVRVVQAPLPTILVLLVPTLKEFLVWRWVFRADAPASTVPRENDALQASQMAGSILTLPKRLALITLIEDGMFADVFPHFFTDGSTADMATRVGLAISLFLVIGSLYFILVYVPLRTPDLVRMKRQGRPLAWVPGFLLEVSCLVFHLWEG